MEKKDKILVLRFSSIGDIVLTTPLLRCLKNIPDKKFSVHYATKKSFAGIIENNPYVDKVHSLDNSLKDLIKELKEENFDFIIDLHKNIRTSIIKFALRKPSCSFMKLNLQKWLLVNFKIDMLPKVHIVDRYIYAANSLEVKNDLQGLDYFLSGKNNDLKEKFFSSLFDKGYVAFVIGGMHFTKRMPNEKIASLCKKLNTHIVLLGGNADKKNGEEISKLAGDNVYNACGEFSLNTSAFLVKNAKVVITHDTGLMHIAAAFKKPIVSLWGNTIPEFGMYPYMPAYENLSRIVEVKGLSCRPCSKIGHKKCPKKHFKCMKDINENEIVEFCNNFL
ncbi:MAG: glycosyltransferase family 9 protein [Bacteroidales bacterium]